uniref:Gem-associated protein 2 n=1 Tax=Heterorhabditis bacteriophora TaxID=37862 RepID=A0A1I7XT97_HETBA
MDDKKGQFVDVGDFDEGSVVLNVAPKSAEQYLKQVMVSRARCPSVVSIQTPPRQASTPARDSNSNVEQGDDKAPKRQWQIAKNCDFSLKRARIDTMPREKIALKIKWPNIGEETLWEELMLRKCHPSAVQYLPLFPNHVATPPALPIVLSLSPTYVNTLIPYFVEWAEAESLTRPIREWLYALLLVVEKPLLHDVCAAIRLLAKLCRRTRRDINAFRQDEILEFSLFIVIVGDYFEQKDLADK